MRRKVLVSSPLTALSVGVLLACLAGCGAPQLISQDQEIQMGREAAKDFEKQNGGRDQDPRRVKLAQQIGQRITAVAARKPYPSYPYEFHVLANSQVNANAFPGGQIYLWRGLYESLKYDPDQLAWVAGHEAAHVAKKHSVQRIERALGYDLIIQLLLGKDSQRQIASAIAGLTLQAYGRDQEAQADAVGLEFAHDAGYDPTASLAVIAAFKQVQGKDPSQLELLFDSHPSNTSRETALKQTLTARGWHGKYF